MRFSRIKVTAAGVELDWSTTDKSGTPIDHHIATPEKAIPSFNQAMQSFSGFVCELISAPNWHDDLRITTVHLSEDSNNRRGIKITADRKIERAKNQPLTFNTPLLHEGKNGEDGNGIYGAQVAEFIAELEREAIRFVKGEREQLDAFADTSTASVDAPDPAEAKQERKPRPSKNAGTPGEIRNPDKTIPPADEALRKLLLDVGRDMPVDAIAHLNSNDRDKIQRWATAQQRVKGGDLRPDAAPKEPKILLELATPALSEEMAGAGGAK